MALRPALATTRAADRLAEVVAGVTGTADGAVDEVRTSTIVTTSAVAVVPGKVDGSEISHATGIENAP